MKFKKLLSVVLALLIIFSMFSFISLKVAASSYSSDYRNWSQGASDNSTMRGYGCWVVAQAKLIYETGVNRNNNFNPDTYLLWQQNNGYINSNFNQTNGGYAPEAYAKTMGKNLTYLGSTSSSIESKIWDNISKGYYSIIGVTGLNSQGKYFSHYVMIANSLSSSNGQLYCYNSYSNYASAAPSSLASRNYVSINYLYSYSTGTHTHNYTIYGYEAAHPHKYYKKCSCGDYYYTGETKYLSSCSTCTNHECNKGEYVWSWDAHPHHSCYECSICGEVWADKSSSNLIDSCSECYPVGKSIVTIDKEQYDVGNSIEISWSEAERATHYNLWIHKKDSDGSYDTVVLREDFLTTNSYTATGLSEGEYRIYIYSYDSTRYMPDQSDWSHQESEPVDFKICILVNYYDWTFNVNSLKAAFDAVLNGDEKPSIIMKEANRGLLYSETVSSKNSLNYPNAPERTGYKFTEWKTVLDPTSGYTESYFIQAQYEPLLYSKGECIYGDMNFDGRVTAVDLVRLKKMVAGISENHVSADLDGDENTNILDICMLRNILLGSTKSNNIYFDANGGTVTETHRLVVCGQSLDELPIPTREGYDFVGWYTSDGTEVTSDIIMTADKEIAAIAHWSAKSYKINWNTGTGYTISVIRTSSPYANASIGTLNNEALIYYGDVLNVTYSATTGYTLKSNGITSATVSRNITSSDIYATASVNSYTYNIVYKSSNGTNLGTATAKYNFGTTNTISPKSFTGYNTPSSQSVKWDSTSAKTITFTYSPVSVSTSQNLSSGAWGVDGNTEFLTYSVKAEYKNRTSTSIQVRIVWTNTLIAYYYYQRGQVFNATIGGKSTGNVTIVPYNTWASSTSSNRSLSGTSAWITVPVSATQTSISISADAFRQHSDGSLVNINESFSKTFNIPTY